MVIRDGFPKDKSVKTEREEKTELNFCLVAWQTNPIQVAPIENEQLLKCSDTQRERKTKEGAGTLTNGRFKFRGSAVSQTLRAPCEREAGRSPSLWSEQRRGMDGKWETWSREKEGRRGEERQRKRLVESHYAAQWLWPDYSQQRPRGHCPPLGHKPQLSGKLVWSTPGTTPTHWGILRHTNKRLYIKHPGCNIHFTLCPKNKIQYHTAWSVYNHKQVQAS